MNKNEERLNRLRDALDPEDWETVVEMWGGRNIYVPVSGCDPEKKKRNSQITTAFFSGATVEELADRYDLSESQIRRIINNR